MSDEPELREMPFRLALCAEGKQWNAYLAGSEGMDDAMLLGSIRLSVVKKSPKLKEAFKALMTEVVADAIEEIVGTRPVFDERTAPESERAGNA